MSQPEKLAQSMKIPGVMMVSFILLVFVYYFVDKPVALYFNQLGLRASAPILSVFDFLGRSKIYLLLFVFLGLFFRFIWKNRTYEKRSWYLLLMVFIPDLLNLALKVIFGRARPELLFLNNDYGFYWFKFSNLYWSLPSGHTTTVIALTWALSALFPRCFFPGLCLALLVIASRVVLCNHYLSDVLVAFYITILVVSPLMDYFRKHKWLNNDLAVDH